MLFLFVTIAVVALFFIINKAVAAKLNYSVFLAFGVSVILFYASLFLSYRALPDIQGTDAWDKMTNADREKAPIATGGFPIKAFKYPVPPMGTDEPPIKSWPLFFANMAIWFVVGNIISAFLPKKYFNSKKAENIILAVFPFSGVVAIYGLLYVLLKFD